MRGRLYGVGVGPGDPELMTLKAVRMIREADVVAVPGEHAKDTVAYQIAVQAVPELETKELLAIYMPMTHDRAKMQENHQKGAKLLEKMLDAGKKVVFLTLGDPTIYSTFSYLQRIVEADGYETGCVSGIPSFCATAARINEPLVEWNEALHIVPAVHRAETEIIGSGNYVFMKSGRKIGKVKELLAQTGKQVFMVENCGMENEHVYRKIEELPEEAGYYSLIIAKEQNAGNEKSDTRVNCCDKSSRKMEVATEQNTEEKRNDSIKWRADQMTEERKVDAQMTEVEKTEYELDDLVEGTEKELLLVSFGTSYLDTLEKTLGEIYRYMEEQFPDYVVEDAFTSQMIIDRLRKRDGIFVSYVDDAVKYAAQHNVHNLVLQPTHLMAGLEYQDLLDAVESYRHLLENVTIGKPVLSAEEDFDWMIRILTDELNGYCDGKTAICLMGHGSEAKANEVYDMLQERFCQKGYTDYLVGTVEAKPALADLVHRVEQGSYERVVLVPLMMVAGDHANSDMAGEEDDSWKSTFEAMGKEVVILMRGLGELKGIQELIADHARAAMKEIDL